MAVIDKEVDLSVVRQCELLGVSRSSVYYQPAPADESDLEVMARIDQIHTDLPLLGSRRIGDVLRYDGLVVNRKRVQRLMRTMGITALYPKQPTSVPHLGIRFTPICCAG